MKELLKGYFTDGRKKPLIVMMFVVYILVTAVCVMGRFFIDGIFLKYARERLEGTVYIIGNGMSGDTDSQIETILLQQNIRHVKYTVYRKNAAGNDVLWAKTPADETVWNDPAVLAFFTESNESRYRDDVLTVGGRRYIFSYMETGNAKHVIVHAYAPFDDFVYDPMARAVIVVYSAAVALVSIIVFSCAGLSMKTVRIKIDMEHEKDKRLAAENTAMATASFLTHMTHEFRTPMNVVLCLAEVIKKKTQDQQIKEYAEDIEHSGLHLLSMVDDILEYASLENGSVSLQESQYDIRNIVHDTDNMTRLQAAKKGLEYQSVISDEVPEMLYGDSGKVKRILINLLNNAVKYTDNGYVHLEVSYSPESEILHIKVQDSGRGIKEEDQEKLFSDFQRMDMVNNATIQGTGLGLSIVKQLLDLMKGSVSVASTYGHGTSFTVSFPQKSVSWDSSVLTDGESFIAPDAHILIIDDTADNLFVMQRILSHTKMHIDTATDGILGLQKIRSRDYDIVFIDARMPGMTGYELFEKIDKENLKKHSHFVMLTANAGSDEKEKSMTAGFDDYLTKPVPVQKLENLIYTLLGPDMVQLVQVNEPSSDVPSWLSSNDLLDHKRGMEMCGSADVYFDALRQFYLHSDDKLNEIRSYLEQGDIKNFTIKVHAVKSVADMIGASGLYDIAAQLETAGINRDMEAIGKKMPGFFGLYNAIVTMLRTVLESHTVPPQEASEIDIGHVAGIINHLKGYVSDYNFEAVGSMINALSQYRFPEEINELFEDFKKAYMNIDWGKMEEITDRIMDNLT